jgi:NADH-quinone oxidoreductase subunit L
MAETLIVTLILLPLLGVLLNTFFVRNGRMAGLLASAVMVVAFAVALALFTQLLGRGGEERAIDFTLYQWIKAGPLSVPFGFRLDPLSMVMTLLITGVGSLIHIFSIGYMAHDARPVRYFVYLNLFVTAMLILVLANNYLLLFLGWEGVGLCSYLLIGHSFERKEARDASLKAFVVNRIGDFGLMLAILGIYSRFNTLNFQQVLPNALGVIGGQQIPFLGGIPVAGALAFLMLIGVAGKSAQIPLFVWLPDAMAGPTPASALIHAATMVTSGVYLIARSFPIWALTPGMQTFAASIGALTAFVAASIAIGQYDIKKVLAYSTVSQLGFMVAAVSMGATVAGIFHLLTHGVFKALLFLGAGSVIHGAHEVQDMRRMGGLRRAMPTTFWTYMFGVLALSGIFPFSGFWSKDEMIGYAWGHGHTVIATILIVTAALTAFYMMRQVALVFLGTQRDTSYHPHESEPIMTVPLMILAVGALLVGFINFPLFHGLDHFLEPVFTASGAPAEPEPFNPVLAIVTVALALGAMYVAYRVYGRRTWKKTFRDPLQPYLGVFFEGFENAWGSDTYVHAFMDPFRSIARFLARIFDPLGIDGLVNGAARLVGLGGRELRQTQTGYLRSYTMVFLVGAIAVLGYFGYAAIR